MEELEPFEPYLARWQLLPDGVPLRTHSSALLAVRQRGLPAMLKLPFEEDEKFNGVLLRYWDGDGAARLLAEDAGRALLIERACGPRSLVQMAREGEDDEATRILCRATARLHTPRNAALPALVSLEEWFRELWPIASERGGVLAQCAAEARTLLDTQRELGVLHGDIHHGNVLDFGARGFLAIDPKRLYGDRAFDYANIFCNPEDDRSLAEGQFARRLEIVADCAGLERARLLAWIAAWTGLSAAWWLLDETPPDLELAVAQRALDALAVERQSG